MNPVWWVPLWKTKTVGSVLLPTAFTCIPAAFRIAVAAKKPGGAVLVTDAMPTVGSPDQSFVLDGATIVARDGRVTSANGHAGGL